MTTTPCGDPGCLGCQDGETCDHQNPAVHLRRRIEKANDEHESSLSEHDRRTTQRHSER
jgi:hypothetical protein